MKKISFLAIFLLTAMLPMAQTLDTKAATRGEGVKVMIETSMGPIEVLLYDETPLHRDNFIKLAESGVYNELLFHRVIKGFMIQAGDPKSRDAKPGQMLGEGSLGYTIPAEIVPQFFHKRGALCAARQGDEVNPKRESSASQFYIVQGNVFDEGTIEKIAQAYKKKFTKEQIKTYTTVGGAPHLDGDYTVFGEVLEGMEIVDEIASVPCDKFNRPLEDVRILNVQIIR